MVLSGKVSVFVEKHLSHGKHRVHDRRRASLSLTLSPMTATVTANAAATRKASVSKSPTQNPFMNAAPDSTPLPLPEAADGEKTGRRRRSSSTTRKRVGFTDEDTANAPASSASAPGGDEKTTGKEAPRKTSLLRALSGRKVSNGGDGSDEGPLDPRGEPVIVERRELGALITSLGQWALFGEMALLNWDRVRRAHVVADGRVALVRVTQELFDLALATVVREVYQAKRFFINGSPVFARWPPDAKEQLMLVLEREVLPFDRRVQRQGDRATHIYFIVKCAHVSPPNSLRSNA